MITKEAKQKENNLNNLIFLKNARTGFLFLLNNIFTHKDNTEVLLVPAYIGESDKEGSGVFDPVRNSKVCYSFYKLDETLSIDLEDLEIKLAKGNVKAVLIIHYFGFPQSNIMAVKKMCKQYGALLIEDCAHSLDSSFEEHKLGNIGDFSFYAIHKLIATESGGILQINNEKYNHLLHMDITSPIDYDTLIQYSRTNIGKTSEVRQHNYKLYLNIIDHHASLFKLLQPTLNDGVVPLNLPILITNYSREKLYYELIDRGIMTVSLYYRMIHEISSSEFPISYNTSNSILNLPVHQDINDEDIIKIVNTLHELNKEHNSK